MRLRRSCPCAAAVLILAGVSPLAAQQTPHPELQARRTATAPVIDGVLSDEVWAGPPLDLGGWVSYNPMRGERAAETTRVWLAYDSRALYVAFQCLDTQPDRIRTTISRRDDAFNDDWVGLSLDSTNAGQLAYHLFVNPSGIQMDALNSGTSGEDFAPDWVWQSAARVGPDGWSAEIRIPLEILRFRGGDDVRMGILFWRRLSRSGVSFAWPELLPGRWIFESHAQVRFAELPTRRLLELIPSATFAGHQQRTPVTAWTGPRTRGDIGLSVKYGLTSSITLDATVNPDFSQVESDAFEVEVNQRFPIFLSEKRPFFMEGLGLFNLAGTGGDASMRTAVHTRRIVDPAAGVRVTGASGRHTFGVLAAPDESPAGEDARAFTVGRHVLNFGQGRYVGAIFTDSRLDGDTNTVVGGDVAFRHGTAFGWNAAVLSSRSSSRPGGDRSGSSGQASYGYTTRRFGLSGQVEHYDRGFRMDTSFLNRVGVTRGWQFGEVNFYPSARVRWLHRITPFVWVTRATDRVQNGSDAFYLPGVRFNLTRAGFVRLDYGRGHETFAGRRFDSGRAMANGSIQLTRWLSTGGSISRGPDILYDPAAPEQGDRTSTNLRIGLQPSARFNSSTSYTYVSLTSRATGLELFDVHIVNARNTFQFTPRFFVRGVLQYDSSRERVLGDFLGSYELSPGTVFHIGYGTLYERQGTASYAGTARALFIKASYLTRF